MDVETYQSNVHDGSSIAITQGLALSRTNFRGSDPLPVNGRFRPISWSERSNCLQRSSPSKACGFNLIGTLFTIANIEIIVFKPPEPKLTRAFKHNTIPKKKTCRFVRLPSAFFAMKFIPSLFTCLVCMPRVISRPVWGLHNILQRGMTRALVYQQFMAVLKYK